MNNYSNKKYRGATELSHTQYGRGAGKSRMYVETQPTQRQCGACKHVFEVPNKVKVRCPECKCEQTRVIN